VFCISGSDREIETHATPLPTVERATVEHRHYGKRGNVSRRDMRIPTTPKVVAISVPLTRLTSRGALFSNRPASATTTRKNVARKALRFQFIGLDFKTAVTASSAIALPRKRSLICGPSLKDASRPGIGGTGPFSPKRDQPRFERGPLVTKHQKA